jgi:hypothetical protein
MDIKEGREVAAQAKARKKLPWENTRAVSPFEFFSFVKN